MWNRGPLAQRIPRPNKGAGKALQFAAPACPRNSCWCALVSVPALGEPGVPPTALPPTFELPFSGSPQYLQLLSSHQEGQSCSSARLQKFPSCSVQLRIPKANPSELKDSPRYHRPRHWGPFTHRSSCWRPLQSERCQPLVAALTPFPGHLRLPLSPAARGVVTPPSLSATRGGAGKWLRARTLRSSASASAAACLLPQCCSAGRGVAGVHALRKRVSRRAGAEGGGCRPRG